MGRTTVLAGSPDVAREVLAGREVALAASADLVIVPTAAAFSGATASVVSLTERLAGLEARVEGVMVGDRAAALEPYFARRVARADVVVLTDGSALHARSVWRDTPLGEAIRDAGLVVAIGSVGSVLFEVMIDPRGGAPTTGLAYRRGLVVTAPAAPEQLARTRSLLGEGVALVVLGRDGALVGDGDRWRVVRDDVVVTRGERPASL